MANWFTKSKTIQKAKDTIVSVFNRPTQNADDGIFKAFIPNFLYKPPYGMPRKVNTPELKLLAKNPYVFSVIKTLCDEATSLDWEIKVKEEFQDVNQETESESSTKPEDYSDKINEITKWFNNPNGNDESLKHIMRQIITDICEIDSGVIVKVFNAQGKMVQIYSRDGSTFLKNPDIYGYMGNKADFVAPLPDGFTGTSIQVDASGSTNTQGQELMKQYGMLYRDSAAYFQYGWTAGSMPVPFGKREIVYFMQNPRSDSIYGRSPIEVLKETIQNLIYGIDFNLDFYTNNNMPEGAIQLLGADQDQIDNFRANWQNQFKFTDGLGESRKRFHQSPISSAEVKFTPFQLTSKDMEVISQQQWFTKILWMCFGVNADEMGYTETSNKASGEQQAAIFKRKAIKPILDVIKYHFDSQIIPEFFSNGKEMVDFGEVPLEFCFDTFDATEEKQSLDILEQEIRMGIKTPEMAAKERGINLEELEESKTKLAEEESAQMEQEAIINGQDYSDIPTTTKKEDKEKDNNNSKQDPKKDEEKGDMDRDKDVDKKSVQDPMKDIEKYIDGVQDALISALDKNAK